MSDVCICPERPELFAGLPIGQYHCGACGCMVLGGVEHLQHDIGCWLLEYDTDTYGRRQGVHVLRSLPELFEDLTIYSSSPCSPPRILRMRGSDIGGLPGNGIWASEICVALTLGMNGQGSQQRRELDDPLVRSA